MSSKVPYSNYRLTARIELRNKSGLFATIIETLTKHKAMVAGVDLIEVQGGKIVRAVTFDVNGEDHGYKVVAEVEKLRGVKVLSVSDQIFLAHVGGKIRVESKYSLKTRHRLSMIYTPGVARVSSALARHPEAVHDLTIKSNSVAVVTDGSAVLGLGNLGPAAALPVMEGKAVIFNQFAKINAWPICLDTQDVDEIVDTVKHIATGFGAINLEDISAPRCFEVESRLKKELDIPVMHDDQHGTAVVILAALKNALKLTKQDISKVKIVINGLGAAGIACCRILIAAGAQNIVGCDKKGAVLTGSAEFMKKNRRRLHEVIEWDKPAMKLKEALKGAHVFIGVSAGNVLKPTDLKLMAKKNIVFAMANPDPEVDPYKAMKYCKVFATGRSDFPNQINNALSFPGIFKGALDVGAKSISESMKLAAATALAKLVSDAELSEEYIIPGVFDERVVPAVALKVSRCAVKNGLVRERKQFRHESLGLPRDGESRKPRAKRKKL